MVALGDVEESCDYGGEDDASPLKGGLQRERMDSRMRMMYNDAAKIAEPVLDMSI